MSREPLAVPDEVTDPTACPRCHKTHEMRFYGPCDTCPADLRATIGGAAREVVAEGYEPKMNVTPNAVATKD
jgi:hypothetical protein